MSSLTFIIFTLPSHNNIVTKLGFILNIKFPMQLFSFVPWPSIADFYDKTLPQINLGVPKFPTLSWLVQEGPKKNHLTLALSKDLN
jgi:hypothetical protein